MPTAEAAVDVDKVSDWELVNRIFAENEAENQAKNQAQSEAAGETSQ
jgi:hypothetical protein